MHCRISYRLASSNSISSLIRVLIDFLAIFASFAVKNVTLSVLILGTSLQWNTLSTVGWTYLTSSVSVNAVTNGLATVCNNVLPAPLRLYFVWGAMIIFCDIISGKV